MNQSSPAQTSCDEVGHIKSADFFDVEKFPRASLVVKKSVVQSAGAYKVIADLTIKNETHEVEFSARLHADKKHVDVALEIDRTVWRLQRH